MRLAWSALGGCLLLASCFTDPPGVSGSGSGSTEGAESSTSASDSDSDSTGVTTTESTTNASATEPTTNPTTGPVDTSSSEGGSSSTGDAPAELPPDMVRLSGTNFGMDINALAVGGSGLLMAGNVQVANPTNRDPVFIALSAEEATIWRLGTVGSNEQGWAVAARATGAALVGLARDSANNVDGALLALTNADFEPVAAWRRTESSGRPIQARAVIPTNGGWIIAGHVGGQSIYVERVDDVGETVRAVEFSFDVDTSDLFPLRLEQNAAGHVAIVVQADENAVFTSLVVVIDGDDDLNLLGSTRLSVVGADVRMSDIHATTDGWLLAGEVANEGAIVELGDALQFVTGSTYSLPRLGAIRPRGETVWIAGGGMGSALAGVVRPEGATVVETPIDAPPVFLPSAVVAGVDNLAMAGDIDGEPVAVFINENPIAACQMQPWGSSLDSGAMDLSLVAELVDVTIGDLSIDRIILPVPTEPTTTVALDNQCL